MSSSSETEIDLFKYLAVNPATLQLTSQEYYSCYSRQILKNSSTSRETKFQQITTLRYFSTIKITDHENTKKIYGEGVLCTAGVWCNRDYTADLIAKNGLCHCCFKALYDKLKKTHKKHEHLNRNHQNSYSPQLPVNSTIARNNYEFCYQVKGVSSPQPNDFTMSTERCSFCGITKGPETCSDCVEMLSTL